MWCMFDEDNSGEIDMQASKKEIKIFAFFLCVRVFIGRLFLIACEHVCLIINARAAEAIN